MIYEKLFEKIKSVDINKLIYNYYLRDFPSGWAMDKSHSHDAVEIICCKEGTINTWVNNIDNVAVIKRLDCLIIKQGAEHKLFINKDMKAHCVCVQIKKELLNIKDEEIPSNNPYFLFENNRFGNRGFIKVIDDEKIFNCLFRIVTDYNSKDSGWELLVKSELVELIIRINRSIEKERLLIEDKSNEYILKAMSYIYQELINPIKPKDIADYVCLSTTHLMHIFKQYTGTTVMQQVTKLRNQRAKDLLLNTTLSVSEIAFQCGYPNIQHFSMVFKKTAGVTPSIYRGEQTKIELLHKNN